MSSSMVRIGDRIRVCATAQLWHGPLYRRLHGIVVGFGDAAGVPDFPGDQPVFYQVARVCIWEPREIALLAISEIEVVERFSPSPRVVSESQAAEFLNLLPSQMRKLLDEAVIDSWSIDPGDGGDPVRYLYYTDVLSYLSRRREQRRQALREMGRVGYDDER